MVFQVFAVHRPTRDLATILILSIGLAVAARVFPLFDFPVRHAARCSIAAFASLSKSESRACQTSHGHRNKSKLSFSLLQLTLFPDLFSSACCLLIVLGLSRYSQRSSLLAVFLVGDPIPPNMAELYPDLKDRPIKETICLFDVDGTLTPARQTVSAEMLQTLSRLRHKVAIGFVSHLNLTLLCLPFNSASD